MSYTALYRKWRPVSLEDVKGQDHIVRTLKNQIRSGRIGHAYLFCGTRGTGKTSVAKILARAVNCENPVDGSPCGSCRTCQNIASGASLNVLEIDAASNNGVDNIREIREQVQYPPTEGRYRVYIIDEVHMLSAGAFNALLKTLEEPPAYVIFILATTDPQKIPITVLSRCQRYDFKRMSIQTLTDRLQELVRAESMDVEERALTYIARAADGSMRDALSLLDQCAAFHYGERLTYEHVLDILGAADTAVFSELLGRICAGDTAACLKKLDELMISGREITQLVNDFIWYLRNLLLVKTAGNAEAILEMSAENEQQLRKDAESVSEAALMRYIRLLADLSGQLRFAGQKRILTELALIRLTRPQMEYSCDSMAERLEKIEERLEAGALPDQEMLKKLMQQGLPAAAAAEKEKEVPQKTVTLPAAQLEDLRLIRNEWSKIIRSGTLGSIRSIFRDTIVEPAGEGSLCIVFASQESFAMGDRPKVLGELEAYVREHYQKEIYFRCRLLGSGERTDTLYVTDEELADRIHMEITVEEEDPE